MSSCDKSILVRDYIRCFDFLDENDQLVPCTNRSDLTRAIQQRQSRASVVQLYVQGKLSTSCAVFVKIKLFEQTTLINRLACTEVVCRKQGLPVRY